MECIDLKQRFGRRYKVRHESEIYGERSRFPTDPWLQVILCRHGHICPWGGENLAACTNKAGRIAAALKRLPFVTGIQDGDDGVNVVFDVKHFAQIAKLMKPRRRRQLTEAQREAARERLAAFQMKPAINASTGAVLGLRAVG